MTETKTVDVTAPFGDSTGRLEHVNTLLGMIRRHAGADEERFGRLLDVFDGTAIPTDEQDTALRAAHHAALYGYGLIAVLRWLFDAYGVGAVFTAARIVEQIAEDGGEEPGELSAEGLDLRSLTVADGAAAEEPGVAEGEQPARDRGVELRHG